MVSMFYISFQIWLRVFILFWGKALTFTNAEMRGVKVLPPHGA